ncbi:hypothetical protein SAMN05443247_09450 [Bradyrhizobium erythrophlei]|jgi:hypothetical protein|nr:hypothetical protein SAMN05443247_09450 [Bradyrhizobium erythrophlei]
MLPTPAQCRAKAKEKAELAEPDPRHRKSLMSAAQAWAFLVDKMEEADSVISNAKSKARKADDTKAQPLTLVPAFDVPPLGGVRCR